MSHSLHSFFILFNCLLETYTDTLFFLQQCEVLVAFPWGQWLPPCQKPLSFSLSIVCLPAHLPTSFVLVCVPLESAVLEENETGAAMAAELKGVSEEQWHLLLTDSHKPTSAARCSSCLPANRTCSYKRGDRVEDTLITTDIHPFGRDQIECNL